MLNSLAFLGFHDIAEINAMTLYEYQLRMEAYQLKRAERHEDIALQAWMNQTVQATRGNGKKPKPKYTKFKDFYDREYEIDRIRSSIEEGYVAQSNKGAQIQRGDIFAKRLEEFKRFKAERRK